jgi:glycine cleavage system H protein
MVASERDVWLRVAVVNVQPAGTRLEVGDESASIEPVRVNLGIPAPVRGRIFEVNQSLAAAPELINQDPCGSGWLVELEPAN